jgi:hypothetical protein
MIGRRLLDDPVLYFDDLTEEEQSYVENPAGRQWLRNRVAEAGFELEERSDGLLAVDPDGLATDLQFPGPHGNAHQLALLLVDDLLTGSDGGRRDPVELSPVELERVVGAVFDRFPNWARSHREHRRPPSPDCRCDRAPRVLRPGTPHARRRCRRPRRRSPATASGLPVLSRVAHVVRRRANGRVDGG